MADGQSASAGRGHSRKRSVILSPTLGNYPFSEEGAARQRRQSSGFHLDGTIDLPEKLGMNGSGNGNGLLFEEKSSSAADVVLQKARQDESVSEGLSGKDRNAFILLTCLCEFSPELALMMGRD